ncbi:MAG: polysaccharide deacetylase family protein [Phycisphaeraceae bacterium JB051]
MAQIAPCILLTFDDCHIDNWYDFLPVLQKYDAKATFYLNNLDKLTDEQITKAEKLMAAGQTIGCHGWRHVWPVQYTEENGVEKFWDDEVKPCIDWYDAHGWNITNYAYAFNNYDETTNARLFDRFDRFRAGSAKTDRTMMASFEDLFFDLDDLPNQRMMPGTHLDTIARSEPKPEIPLELWQQILTRLADNGQHMTFYGHNISATDKQGHVTNPQYLEEVLKLSKQMNVACVGMDDLPAVVR